QSYWGDNYARLAEIKNKYDPDGLFIVHNGVGSEGGAPTASRNFKKVIRDGRVCTAAGRRGAHQPRPRRLAGSTGGALRRVAFRPAEIRLFTEQRNSGGLVDAPGNTR